MRAGTLRHRLTFQRRVVLPDEVGGEVESWGNIATVWARIEQLTGREFFAAQQINSEINTKITIRPMAVTADMRAVIPGTTRYFNLSPAVDKTGLGRELEMYATEKAFLSPYVPEPSVFYVAGGEEFILAD